MGVRIRVPRRWPARVRVLRPGGQPLRTEPIYRWVPTGIDGNLSTYVDDTGRQVVDGLSQDTLAALGRAACEQTTVRHLPEGWRNAAYSAWEAARDDIFEDWSAKTDPMALQRPIPKPLRDAVALLDEFPPPGMDAAEVDRLRDALEVPYDTRTQRAIRAAINDHDTPHDKVEAVIAEVRRLGLEPPAPTRTLPEIAKDDIYLVCWMALTPPAELRN